MRVLVTGATGFVGGALCSCLAGSGHRVRAAVRSGTVPSPTDENGVAERVVVGEIGPETDWTEALSGVDAVVHLAARTHVMREHSADPLAEYRRVNVQGTARLATAAAAAGVRRLVFVSSVKVNGESTSGAPFREADTPRPEDPYGVSKREAEEAFWEVAGDRVEGVVVRPPLMYGPGVRANFLRMMQAIDRGTPLPLGAIRNARSLLYVGNLANALAVCVRHPGATGETFLVSDGEPVSTPQLVRTLAEALGRPARLVAVPTPVLRAVGSMLGRSAAIRRLTGSLVVDDGKIRRALGWNPPYSFEEGIARTAAWLRQRHPASAAR